MVLLPNLPLPVLRLRQLSLSFLRCLRFSATVFQPSHPPSSNPESLAFRIRSSLRIYSQKDDLLPLKALIIVGGLNDDETLNSAFIRRCFDLGDPELALSTFGRFAGKPSLFLQNLAIRRLSDSGLYKQLLSVYCKCVLAGCTSDCYTFPFVIKACAALRRGGSGKEVHAVVFRIGYERNVVVQTALVYFYGRIGQVDIARKVFGRIAQPDVVSWNALISGFALNGLVFEAFSTLRRIWVNGLKPNVSTLASIIPICSRTRCLYLGKALHGYAVKSGIDLDQLLIPAVISMYASNGDLFNARSLFDFSPIKNDAIWNSMIHSYTEYMEPHEAYKTFSQMLRAELQPNAVSFVSFIPCCENLDSIWAGDCLHACVVKYGLGSHVHVVTALMTTYAKHGNVKSAEILFDSVHDKNLLTCNSMISGYLYNELWDTALRAVANMQSAGFIPDAISLIGVLSACSKLEDLLVGRSAHGFSIRRGLDAELNLSNALLAFYSRCNQLCISFRIFQRMNVRDSVSWNTLVSGCVYNQETESVLALLWQMQQEGAKIDSVTMISALPSFNEACDLKYGMSVHGYAINSGFAVDVSLGNALVSMYSSCGDLDAALSLFDTMLEKDVVSWNSLITGYRYSNLQNEAMTLLKRMLEAGVKPNHVTLLNLLPTCCLLSQGKSVHAYAMRAGLVSQTPLITSLLTMYARFEATKPCFALFEIGDKSNISLWNAMISVLVQAINIQGAVALFHKLLESRLLVDQVTILTLISASVILEDINFSKSVLSYVMKNGFIKDITISNALIDLHAKCGDISISREIFELLYDKDSITWSAMINGYGLHGDGKTAFDLFLKMKDSGIAPDNITCLNVLSACSHSGLVEQAIMVFTSMLEAGITATMEHCGCIMDLLGRTGHLDEAYDLLKRLPSGASTSMLESLLGACAFHGNVKIGEKVGEEILKRDSMNSGSYVMLHNIYAGAGRWAEANSVRKRMDEKKMRKAPGVSKLERQRIVIPTQ